MFCLDNFFVFFNNANNFIELGKAILLGKFCKTFILNFDSKQHYSEQTVLFIFELTQLSIGIYIIEIILFSNVVSIFHSLQAY